MSTDDTAPPEDDELIRCWCGAEGTYEELFNDWGLDNSCGGSGVVYCYCNGDLCVCHRHGEAECDGCDDCDDCRPDQDDWYEEHDE